MNNVIYFLPGVSDEERTDVYRLVYKNYPGLLENGVMHWSTLHKSRTRRAAGMPKDRAYEIFSGFNKIRAGRGETTLDVTSMKEWPSRPDRLTKKMKAANVSANEAHATEFIELPHPPRDGERQMVYGLWPGDGDVNEAEELMQYKFDSKYVVSPWNPPLGEAKHPETDPNAQWNMLLNIAATTVAMEMENGGEYPVRVLLPKHFQTKLVRSKFVSSPENKLVAVLHLNFQVDNKTFDSPPHVAHGFVPLFVYKMPQWTRDYTGSAVLLRQYETYKLINYRGNVVDWGDFSKRKAVSYYELRDIMAHMSKESPNKWTMLQVTSNSNTYFTHYLLRKRLSPPEVEEKRIMEEKEKGLIPVCIDWTEPGGSIRFKERRPILPCFYSGYKRDFQRLSLVHEDERNDTNYSGLAAHYDAESDAPLPKSFSRVLPHTQNTPTPNKLSFGLYGDPAAPGVRATENYNHLTTAVEFWSRQLPNENPLPYLQLAFENREPAAIGGDAPYRSLGRCSLAVCVLGLSATLAACVTRA